MSLQTIARRTGQTPTTVMRVLRDVKCRAFEAQLGVMGIRDICEKNLTDTVYLKKKYGDIQREVYGYETAQLRGYGIFQEKV